jgi:hypothetical protein
MNRTTKTNHSTFLKISQQLCRLERQKQTATKLQNQNDISVTPANIQTRKQTKILGEQYTIKR